ncbi:MAG: M48 family metalloprotease [Gammaproteobacteria bacterium]|nr:M48 family metalloprotease [Gammaproteobacteria bacterium]
MTNSNPPTPGATCRPLFGATLLLWLLLAAMGTQAWAEINLPNIGDGTSALLSPEEERRIGQLFMRQVRAQLPLIDDLELNRYIQSLGFRLAANSDTAARDYHFFLIDADSINAFAAPGGYIGIHTGLFTTSRSESELAAVVAHEIAHITQSHLHRSLAKAGRMQIPSILALLGAIVLASQDSQAGVAAISAVTAGTIQAQINFTRAHEREADRIGIQTLARAGLDPAAMPDFFQRMQDANRFQQGNIPDLLRTHPVTLERVADSRTRAEHYGYRQVPDSRAYLHMLAKLEALKGSRTDRAVTLFRQRLTQKKYRDERATLFGYAVALNRDKQIEPARAVLQQLLALDPGYLSYRLLAVEIERMAGDQQAALRHARTALALSPGHPVATVYLAETLLDNGNPDAARELMAGLLRNDHLERLPPKAWFVAAQAADSSGRRVEGLRMLAEYHYQNGDLETALQGLRSAAATPGIEFIDLSAIESRMRQIEAEAAALRELM